MTLTRDNSLIIREKENPELRDVFTILVQDYFADYILWLEEDNTGEIQFILNCDTLHLIEDIIIILKENKKLGFDISFDETEEKVLIDFYEIIKQYFKELKEESVIISYY